METDFYKPRTFIAKKNDIQLKLVEMVEPNYGRMVWLYQFFIEGELVTDKYHNYSKYGPFLSPNLNDFELESPDGKCILIPQENRMLLYNTINKIYIEYGGLGLHFLKNKFFENTLLIIGTKVIRIINLVNYNSQILQFYTNINLIDTEFNNGKLMVTYKNLDNYTTQTQRYDFEKMDLFNS